METLPVKEGMVVCDNADGCVETCDHKLTHRPTGWCRYTVFSAIVLVISGCYSHVKVMIPDRGMESTTIMEPVGETVKTPDNVTPKVKPVVSDPLPSIIGRVYFDYDRWTITSESVDRLSLAVKYLNETNETINIFGYCDERGTVEYNQSLGMRRANNVKSIMFTLGLNPDRIASVVSYGKERPVCFDHNEDCWKQNRRVDIVVVR